MKPESTSKETILHISRQLVSKTGLSALNMRNLAEECGIAPGTLYHYYTNKDELMLAVIESIWNDIFRDEPDLSGTTDFAGFVAGFFECVKKGSADYPGFLSAHSAVITDERKNEARSTMKHIFNHMKHCLLASLQADPNVSQTSFSCTFTPEDFIDFTFDHLLLLLARDETDCHSLTEVIRRTLY